MTEALIQRKKNEGEQEIMLRLLESVESEEAVSQDQFARRIGIAKGLANAYFSRCLSKGWIKLRQVPKRRFLYYLTPKGFAEKARLSAQFLAHSYRLYREARADLSSLMVEAGRLGHKHIGVLGASELAEIAAIVSEEAPVAIVGFVGPAGERQYIAGRPIVSKWSELKGADCAILATPHNTQAVFDSFRDEQPLVPIFVPEQLRSLMGKRGRRSEKS